MFETKKVASEGTHGTGRSEAAESTKSTAGSLLARPLVLPEIFNCTGNWSDWSFHFENVAAVNDWDDAHKLQ